MPATLTLDHAPAAVALLGLDALEATDLVVVIAIAAFAVVTLLVPLMLLMGRSRHERLVRKIPLAQRMRQPAVTPVPADLRARQMPPSRSEVPGDGQPEPSRVVREGAAEPGAPAEAPPVLTEPVPDIEAASDVEAAAPPEGDEPPRRRPPRSYMGAPATSQGATPTAGAQRRPHRGPFPSDSPRIHAGERASAPAQPELTPLPADVSSRPVAPARVASPPPAPPPAARASHPAPPSPARPAHATSRAIEPHRTPLERYATRSTASAVLVGVATSVAATAALWFLTRSASPRRER